MLCISYFIAGDVIIGNCLLSYEVIKISNYKSIDIIFAT